MTDCAGRQGPPKVNYNVVVFVFVFVVSDWCCVEFPTADSSRVGYRRRQRQQPQQQQQHPLQPSARQSSAFFKESVT
ncbi:AAEL001834-PA [Aedes aegypti]|uniref:AAEL001834-PA n=1 Tax=Aedes aegypti TaxID=7159 RepID=Q17K24_AEDAE|nr:AAEL001834-PA [Aedes aegypti]